MDIVADDGAIISDKPRFLSRRLVLDAAATNPLIYFAMHKSRLRAGQAIEQVKQWENKYRVIHDACSHLIRPPGLLDL